LIEVLMTGDVDLVEMLYGPPVETVLSALRNTLIAGPGRVFAAGDFSQIEARICLALAGQWDKVDMLAAKLDPYCDMATSIYGRAITKADVEERQIGKNSVLGLGFGMGWWKFQLKYAPLASEAFCRGVVTTYREVWAPEVPRLWKALERAALNTVLTGKAHEAAGVVYALEDQWLTARLPSGRKLWYFNPRAVKRHMPWSTEENPDVRMAWTYQAKKSGKWLTIDAFGGLLCENVCQALARDLLVAAMFKCEAEDIPVVLTVHDEVVGEPSERRADAAKVLEQIMVDIPDWARYLRIPAAAECWAGDRYRK
jgi:DNA polymerase